MQNQDVGCGCLIVVLAFFLLGAEIMLELKALNKNIEWFTRLYSTEIARKSE